MRFDHEWQGDGTLYAGRHRKGRLPLRAGRARGYLQRVRASRAADPPPAHRALPAAYDEQRAPGR